MGLRSQHSVGGAGTHQVELGATGEGDQRHTGEEGPVASEVRGPESRSARCRALGFGGWSKAQVCAMWSMAPELSRGQAAGCQSGRHAVQVSRGGSRWRPSGQSPQGGEQSCSSQEAPRGWKQGPGRVGASLAGSGGASTMRCVTREGMAAPGEKGQAARRGSTWGQGSRVPLWCRREP